MKLHCTLLSMFLLAGCTTPVRDDQVRFTVDSYPAGAQLRVIGVSPLSGIAPQTWTWNLQPGSPGGYIKVVARWVSGAETTTTLKVPIGQHLRFTLNRPNVPGAEADVQWAIAQQQKAEADKAARQYAFSEALRSYNENKAVQMRQPVTITPITSCRSTVTGNIINTDCR